MPNDSFFFFGIWNHKPVVILICLIFENECTRIEIFFGHHRSQSNHEGLARMTSSKKGSIGSFQSFFLAEEFSSEEGTSCSVVTSGCWSKSTSPWQVAEELHTNGMKVRYSLNSCRLDAFETVHVVQPLAAGCVALSSHESRTRCRCRERINIPYSSLLQNWMVWIFEQRTLQFPES